MVNLPIPRDTECDLFSIYRRSSLPISEGVREDSTRDNVVREDLSQNIGVGELRIER